MDIWYYFEYVLQDVQPCTIKHEELLWQHKP